MVVRVCVIGAGPSGMGLVGQLKRLEEEGERVEVTCYEKQDRPGGLWNLTWRTGVDEWGEPQHCSQYRDLFSNGPKECLELPDYTFADHFGKPIPSFPPRQVLLDCLEGYWRHLGVDGERDVRTGCCVRGVEYDAGRERFTVHASNLRSGGRDEVGEFDYVAVASGHFSTPHQPNIDGIATFPGPILHAHDFRDARHFTAKRLLVVGSSYSAEDVALQCHKFGAARVTISYRTAPMAFRWPADIEELPLVMRVEGSRCHFRDGTHRDVDAIIMCTGYRHHFPFMPDALRLECSNVIHPPDLYRGIQWRGRNDSAGGRLFYLGMQDQYYTFSMFMLQGMWTAHVVKGLLAQPAREEWEGELSRAADRNAALEDCHAEIDAQSDYVKRLAADIGYQVEVDVGELFHEWERHKREDILTYRDQRFVSHFTGQRGPAHRLPWLRCFDDSLEAFIE